MKKLIMMDPVQICGSDLTSGTSDEKREWMGYDSHPEITRSSCWCKWIEMDWNSLQALK